MQQPVDIFEKIDTGHGSSTFCTKSSARGIPRLNVVGSSGAFRKTLDVITRLSKSKATVLFKGESGTGKRVLAYALHKLDPVRSEKPFIEVNCGALPKDIIESELFGHSRGAFTGAIRDRKGRFELADGGTILLDDIDSMPLDLQAKLLRVLQHKEFERVGDSMTLKVDVRIITTTNQDLKKLVSEGRFREDLFYRINVVPVDVPPLRDRAGDIRELTKDMAERFAHQNAREITVSEEFLERLTTYSWPGNVRELENVIERGVILDMDGILRADDLPEAILSECMREGEEIASAKDIDGIKNATLKEFIKDRERIYILDVIKETGGSKRRAASKLGINRTTLYNKMREHKIEI